ncbi:hypothetical protein ACFQY5_25710 [Paeniroseomonas aquatica]|uniref:hypothetical protein n=1 Tax=Paeniroseomonas aquatica TaxID=373043 RepID=UPI0036126297
MPGLSLRYPPRSYWNWPPSEAEKRPSAEVRVGRLAGKVSRPASGAGAAATTGAAGAVSSRRRVSCTSARVRSASCRAARVSASRVAASRRSRVNSDCRARSWRSIDSIRAPSCAMAGMGAAAASTRPPSSPLA